MKRVRRLLREEPFKVDAILAVAVAVHATLSLLGVLPNIWAALSGARNLAEAQAIYLAILGPASIVAGFAGVVVVFGLSAGSSRFRKFRSMAGASLKRTWVASTLSGFVAAALCVVASVVNLTDWSGVAPFLLELSLLVLAHGAIRLVWILSEMIGITRVDDAKATDEASKFPVSRLPFQKKVG